MKLARAEPDECTLVKQRIDADFGQGVAEKLQNNRVLLTLKRDSDTSFYLVPEDWVEKVLVESEGFAPQMLGMWLGDMSGGKFKLALSVLHHMAALTNSRLVVSRHAAEAFTYGRSILRESIVKIEPNLQRGQQVLVLNKEEECMGLAVLSVDAGRIHSLGPQELVAKNQMDIGWYLRRFT